MKLIEFRQTGRPYPVYYYYNPNFKKYTEGQYFLGEIKDERVCWLANMVVYYRAKLPSWYKCWGKYGDSYRRGWFRDYDSEKMKVNERQKRKILKNHLEFLKENGITVDHFKLLKHVDPKTIELVERKLNGRAIPKVTVSTDNPF